MDTKPISYQKAIRQEPKEPHAQYFGIDIYEETLVKWTAQLEAPQVIKLKTIGEVKIVVPPKLPAGYKMVRHHTWEYILPKLIKGGETYPPEYIHHFEQDVRYLGTLGIHLRIGNLEELIGTENYNRYGDWIEGHSEAWYELRDNTFELFYKASGFPKGGGEMDLPSRPAPCIKEVLIKMMRLLPDGA
jgi:hypothetical protein